jgi:hypothetical protein
VNSPLRMGSPSPNRLRACSLPTRHSCSVPPGLQPPLIPSQVAAARPLQIWGLDSLHSLGIGFVLRLVSNPSPLIVTQIGLSFTLSHRSVCRFFHRGQAGHGWASQADQILLSVNEVIAFEKFTQGNICGPFFHLPGRLLVLNIPGTLDVMLYKTNCHFFIYFSMQVMPVSMECIPVHISSVRICQPFFKGICNASLIHELFKHFECYEQNL